MRKKLIILATIVFLLNNVKAQDKFMHSYGATIAFMTSKDTYSGKANSLLHTNLTYFPRLLLTQSDKSSVSVGAPIGVGIGILRNTYGDASSIFWGFDIPVVADYNFGCKSSSDNEDNFGGYVGAGFGYNFTNWKPYDESKSASSYGPILRAGVRFSFANWESQAVSIGFYYKHGLETEKFKTYGMNVLVDL